MRKLLPLSLTPLAFALACSSSDNDSGSTPKDGGVRVDTGIVEQMDSGSPDTGGAPDSGIPPMCNPLDGSGCAMNQFCVLQQSGMGQCRALPAQNTHEMACDAAAQNCAPGYMCIVFQGEAGPTCRKVCDANAAMSCSGVTGASANYVCTTFVANADYGVCTGTGATCTPVMDTCPMNETCALQGAQGDTACVPAGTGTIGMACAGAMGTSGCADGVCINLQGTAGPICYEACDATHACTGMSSACAMLTGISFGICQTVTACSPVMDTCPMSQMCGLVSMTQTACIPEGTRMVGQTCGGANGNCLKGGICLNVGMGAQCYQPCDPAVMPTTCTMGACAGLQGLTFGVCN